MVGRNEGLWFGGLKALRQIGGDGGGGSGHVGRRGETGGWKERGREGVREGEQAGHRVLIFKKRNAQLKHGLMRLHLSW